MKTKSATDSFANIWMVDYVIIIFSMVRYNKYEYLQHDLFPLERQKKINCIMKKLNLFLQWFDTKSMNVCNMMYFL